MIVADREGSNSVDNSRLTYLPKRPLVEDEYKQYIFLLTDDDVADPKVETKYGPFDELLPVTPPSPTPILQTRQSMFDRQKEIDRLKKQIEQREASRAAELQRLKGNEEAEFSRQAVEQVQTSQEQDARSTLDMQSLGSEVDGQIFKVEANEMDSMRLDLEERLIIQPTTVEENALNLQLSDTIIQKAAPSKPVQRTNVITIDSDSDMGEEEGEESLNNQDISNTTNVPESTEPVANDIAMEVDPIQNTETEETEETMALKAEIEDLKNQLAQVESEKNMHAIKLLGIRVKISINKNRRETARTQTTPEQSPAPVLGTKRRPYSNYIPPPKRRSHIDPHSNTLPQPSQPPPPPPRPPQPFQHQIPPFYQQINPLQPPPPSVPTYFGPSIPNYYGVPHMDMPLGSSPAFYPPPPPADLPPPPSPPPPPPPEIQVLPPPPPLTIPPRNRRETPYAGLNGPDAAHAKDFENMSNILRDVEQLVSLRIFNDNQTSAPILDDRPLPRPYRLVSFDGYTMPMRMLCLQEESDDDSGWRQRTQSFFLPAGQCVLFEMTNVSYDSPFFTMLSRKAQGEQFDQSLDAIISAILLSIPFDLDLSTFHFRHVNGESLYPEKLRNTYSLVRAFSQDYPTNQFYAALTLELCLYVHGPNSEQFQADITECRAHLALCVDVEWQYIMEAAFSEDQMKRIKDLLQNINNSRSSLESKESVIASCKTAQVLTRVIRLYGIDGVLKLLTGSDSIYSTQAHIFSLNDISGLFLLEKDKLYVWMLLLHYLITGTLPEVVCKSWMNQLVKNAEPVLFTNLFTLDWTETLKDKPLDNKTLYAATNILLSLFSHFGNMACSDTREKPLFIGVIRTMVSFLSCTAAYKIPGALVLTAKLGVTSTLQPEIGEMIAELQFKRDNSSLVPLNFLMDGCKSRKRPQLFSLAYYMACLFKEKNPLNSENCLLLACMLSVPLIHDRRNRASMESILSDEYKTYDDARKGNMIDSIRLKYMDLVNLGTKKQDPSSLELYRRTAFVWINLLLLTKLTIILRPELTLGLNEKLGQVFIEGRKYLTSYDGKMIFFKYGKELMKIE